MKKYLVINYYSWDGDFGVDASELKDSKNQARLTQKKILNDNISNFLADDMVVVLGAEEIENEILDNFPDGTIIIEHIDDSYIITQYGKSSIRHQEILIKEVEV